MKKNLAHLFANNFVTLEAIFKAMRIVGVVKSQKVEVIRSLASAERERKLALIFALKIIHFF